ncbi:Bifunctional epoxide hydrolase 2 [Linnemannia zychae]|nr:Bifunctional epoxide hydrolase 2 [Linnemannia zychae]
MTIPFIDPNSFEHKFIQTKGIKYHYVEAGDPKGEPLLFIHGFPEFWYAWRFQIKHFAELGYRVIALDTLGYGQTDAPMELYKYGLKSQVEQWVEILDILEIPKVTLLGHDWGGAYVWRFGLYHPERLTGIISICTPYHPPSSVFRTLEEIIEAVPDLKYQRFLADPATVQILDAGKEDFFKPLLESGGCGDSKAELDYVLQEFNRTGMRGPLNYYKCTRVNFDDELETIPHRHQHMIHLPCWIIHAEHDIYLKPYMAEGMIHYIPNLKKATVDAGHFCMTEKYNEVNAALKTAIEDVLERSKKAEGVKAAEDATKASL